MIEPVPFNLVESLQGHDKGTLYQVLGVENGRLWLTDGRLRPLAKPKKKNSRHVRPMALCDRAPATDKEIRTTLALAAQAAAKKGDQLGER